MINITKISGVISFTQDSNQPKSYFGSRGKYTVGSDDVTIQIQINEDNYQVAYTNLQVNGQTPVSIAVAKILLTAVLGS